MKEANQSGLKLALARIGEILTEIGRLLLQGLIFIGSWCRNYLSRFLHRMKTNPKYRQRFISMMILPAAIWYYELVFNLSTEPTLFSTRAWLLIPLFSISWGLFFFLFCSISRHPRINRRIVKVFLILTMIPFAVEYFIYRQFHIFYDLRTVFAGAGKAVTGFGGTIARLIFSPSGLLHVFLFLLPFLLYFWRGKRVDAARRISGKFRIRVVIGLVIFYLLALLFTVTGSYTRGVYGSKYNFRSAIHEFGLLTADRKEIQHLISGRSGTASFQTVEESVSSGSESVISSSSNTETSTKTASPVKEKNEMALNFDGAGDVDLTAGIEEMNEYVQIQQASATNEYTGLFKGKNLIFFSAEAFSPWFVSEDLTPTLYRLIHKGIYFSDYYQPTSAGTTGGEVQNLLGILPMNGGDSMLNTLTHNNYFTMGSQLNRLGYYGRPFHDNDYTFYDRNETHNNLGYSDTFMGYGNGMEEYVTAQWTESDLEMMQGTMPLYIDKQPFNIYYMTVSGHSEYSLDTNAMSRKNYDRVKDLDYSEEVKCYIAANLELEDALTFTVKELEQKGIADDTVIVLSPDHFPYGIDSDSTLEELYGHAINNSWDRDKNALIIWSGCLEDMDPIEVDTPVSSLDILPTLSNLFGTEFDSRLMVGRDVFSDADPLIFNVSYDWKTDRGTYIYADGTFTPAVSGDEVSDSYIDRMNTIVSNKIHFCQLMLDNDYYGYLFGMSDTQTNNPNAGSTTTDTDTESASSDTDAASTSSDTDAGSASSDTDAAGTSSNKNTGSASSDTNTGNASSDTDAKSASSDQKS